MKPGLLLKIVFFFPGTFLHELAHYLAACLLGSAEGFSMMPSVQGSQLVFGSVKSRTRFAVLSSFIASAPLLWWAMIIGMLLYYGVVTAEFTIDFARLRGRLRSFSLRDLVAAWVFIQLLWAGKLSRVDLKNFLRGWFSPSGAIVLAFAGALLWLRIRL